MVHTKLAVGALLAVAALTVSSCADAPAEKATSSTENSDFKACMVAGPSGVNDGGFNEQAWRGVQAAVDQLGIEGMHVEAPSDSEYKTTIDALIGKDCGLILTVGFLTADATKAAAEAHPDQRFAIVDSSFDPPLENVLGITFDTAEASFLAGYLAAGASKTGVVATYGGIKIPPVALFMDGYWQGVQHYNEESGSSVRVLGWDAESQNGTFMGNFNDQEKGKQITQTFMQQGADVIFALAGLGNVGGRAAVEQQGKGAVSWVGVDTDGCEVYPEQCAIHLTSVLKDVQVSVADVIATIVEDKFEGGLYLGNLANDGVGLAPLHEHEGDVSPELMDEVDELRKQIIAGDLTVDSVNKPTTD